MNEVSLAELEQYLSQLTLETIISHPELRHHIKPAKLTNLGIHIDAKSVAERRHSHSVKAALNDWFIWSLGGKPHCTGYVASDRYWLTTSTVIAIAEDRSCLFTQSGSLYPLGDEAVDPPTHALICIAATLNGWGLGRALGIPPFFF